MSSIVQFLGQRIELSSNIVIRVITRELPIIISYRYSYYQQHSTDRELVLRKEMPLTLQVNKLKTMQKN